MDFDSDGRLDVLSGSYPGELYLFKGKGDGQFARSVQLTHADEKPIKLGFAAVVYAHDWDGDSDLDLFVGDIEGQVHLVKNDGSKNAPKFAAAQLLKAGNAPIKVAGGDAGPSVADWDGDGKFDLLVGTGAGGVVWYRNTGGSDNPQLAAAQTLVAEPAKNSDGDLKFEGPAPHRGTRAKVHATDWNKDGKLDLLVGDFSYRQQSEPAQTAEEQAAQKAKQDAWTKEYQALQQAPLDETKEARQARMKKTAELVAEFNAQKANARQEPPSQYHGYVWLYLRQGAVARAE